jgi:hypothetical protein
MNLKGLYYNLVTRQVTGRYRIYPFNYQSICMYASVARPPSQRAGPRLVPRWGPSSIVIVVKI